MDDRVVKQIKKYISEHSRVQVELKNIYFYTRIANDSDVVINFKGKITYQEALEHIGNFVKDTTKDNHVLGFTDSKNWHQYIEITRLNKGDDIEISTFNSKKYFGSNTQITVDELPMIEQLLKIFWVEAMHTPKIDHYFSHSQITMFFHLGFWIGLIGFIIDRSLILFSLGIFMIFLLPSVADAYFKKQIHSESFVGLIFKNKYDPPHVFQGKKGQIALHLTKGMFLIYLIWLIFSIIKITMNSR